MHRSNQLWTLRACGPGEPCFGESAVCEPAYSLSWMTKKRETGASIFSETTKIYRSAALQKYHKSSPHHSYDHVYLFIEIPKPKASHRIHPPAHFLCALAVFYATVVIGAGKAEVSRVRSTVGHEAQKQSKRQRKAKEGQGKQRKAKETMQSK